MPYQIAKRFDFSASHILDGLPEDHPCGRLHGHNYTIELVLAGELDSIGFVVDYGALAPFKEFVDAMLDHRHLNDVVDRNPTAENLARWLHFIASTTMPFGDKIAAVRVAETPKTWAEYRP